MKIITLSSRNKRKKGTGFMKGWRNGVAKSGETETG